MWGDSYRQNGFNPSMISNYGCQFVEPRYCFILYYAINLDIVSSFIVLNNSYFGSIDLSTSLNQ